MTDAFSIVMAGGSGTRFWPLSRARRPKQLLPLAGGTESLLAATVRRALRVGAPERVLVVTSEALAPAVRAELPMLPPENVLAEPIGRNTAPCVGWAATRVARIDPDAPCAVLPADHHIGDEDAYAQVLELALRASEHASIVTVGIRPTRAETGYGYVEMGEALEPGVHRARRFVEKPNRQRAEQFLAAGTFLWNSGMFFFRASAILDAIRTHLPGLGAALERISSCDLEKEPSLVAELYPALPSISIDHGVMEKMQDVAVVPGSFGWSDLGSFATAWELAGGGSVVPPGTVTVDAGGCYVRAPEGKLVALVGVSDLVVIDTEDALLVVPRDRAQDVKKVVDALAARGETDKL